MFIRVIAGRRYPLVAFACAGSDPAKALRTRSGVTVRAHKFVRVGGAVSLRH